MPRGRKSLTEQPVRLIELNLSAGDAAFARRPVPRFGALPRRGQCCYLNLRTVEPGVRGREVLDALPRKVCILACGVKFRAPPGINAPEYPIKLS